MQGVERHKVRLLPHDASWNDEFQNVKAQIRRIWPDNVLDIQHIGSTAIRGICAKPILDIAIVVQSLHDMDIEAMTQAGYEFCGYQNLEQSRCLFVLRGGGAISLHHIHCYAPDDENFLQCLGFRDYLNSHPQAAAEYAALKENLAALHPDDRVLYANDKADFIQMICQKAMESIMGGVK